MPATATASAAAASAPSAPSVTTSRKSSAVPEKKYKCQFCNRAFSRSEHRSRHERSRKSLIYISFSLQVGLASHGGVVSANLSRNRQPTPHFPLIPHPSSLNCPPLSPLSYSFFP